MKKKSPLMKLWSLAHIKEVQLKLIEAMFSQVHFKSRQAVCSHASSKVCGKHAQMCELSPRIMQTPMA